MTHTCEDYKIIKLEPADPPVGGCHRAIRNFIAEAAVVYQKASLQVRKQKI